MLKQIKEYFVPGKKNLIITYVVFSAPMILGFNMLNTLYKIFWCKLVWVFIDCLLIIIIIAFRSYLKRDDPLYIHYLYLTRIKLIPVLWVINFMIFLLSLFAAEFSYLGLILSAVILIRHVMYYFNIPQYLWIVIELSLLSPTHCCYFSFLHNWSYIVLLYGFYHVLRIKDKKQPKQLHLDEVI